MKGLCRISVSTTAEAEDAVLDLLQRVSGASPASYTDQRTQSVCLSAYLAGDIKALRALQAELARALRQISECGLNVGSGTIRLTALRPENWAQSWRRHFKPLEFGTRLLVKPPWNRRAARKGQRVVILNPGLSFGTGQHPTTAYCLEQIVAARHPGRPQSFLDIGTGSGILAIAAVKLGYSPVRAFDYDPQCIRIADANCRKNRVRESLVLRRQDVARLPLRLSKVRSVICANLIAPLLIHQSMRIAAQLAPQGCLVVAGILKTEFDAVKSAYENAGLALVRSRIEKEWRSGVFRKRALA